MLQVVQTLVIKIKLTRYPMKVIKTKLILISLLSFLSIFTFVIPQTFATSFQNSQLIARLTLDPNLKPQNSPGVIIGQETLKKEGSETALINYTLQVLAGALINLAAPIAIIIIAISGLYAVISHGNQSLIEKAKKTLQWAVIGLVIIIFSWVIIRTVLTIIIDANSNQEISEQTQITEPETPSSKPTTKETPGGSEGASDGSDVS